MVKIPTMYKGTITYAIKVDKSSDNLPIVEKPSIDTKTLTKPITVEGPSIATNNPSILEGSSNIKPYCHPNHKIHCTNKKLVHILEH
jgi:hypothetical protein